MTTKKQKGYYMVMCTILEEDGPVVEPWTGRKWDLEDELNAHEELWDALHDGTVLAPYIREVIFSDEED